VWPLRKLVVRCFEFSGRVLMIPTVILTYLVCFWPAMNYIKISFAIIFVVLAIVSIAMRYRPELQSTALSTTTAIYAKKKKGTGLSSLEVLYLQCGERWSCLCGDCGFATTGKQQQEQDGGKGFRIGVPYGVEMQPSSSFTNNPTSSNPTGGSNNESVKYPNGCESMFDSVRHNSSSFSVNTVGGTLNPLSGH
jgi:hypothetical protein